MRNIIAETVGAVHTHTHTQGNLINKNVGTHYIRPCSNARAKHEIIETDQLII